MPTSSYEDLIDEMEAREKKQQENDLKEEAKQLRFFSKQSPCTKAILEAPTDAKQKVITIFDMFLINKKDFIDQINEGFKKMEQEEKEEEER